MNLYMSPFFTSYGDVWLILMKRSLSHMPIDMGNNLTALYPGNRHPMHALTQPASMQGHPMPYSSDLTTTMQGNSRGYDQGYYKDHFRPHGTDLRGSYHLSAQHLSGALPETPIQGGGAGIPQSEWPISQKSKFPHNSNRSLPPNLVSSGRVQPFFDSYTSRQNTENSFGEFLPLSSQSSNTSVPSSDASGRKTGADVTLDPFLAHSHVGHTHAMPGLSTTQSHAQQHNNLHQSLAYGQHQRTTMAQSHLENGSNPLAFPSAQASQKNAPHYQLPLLQADAQQCLPHHQSSLGDGHSGMVDMGYSGRRYDPLVSADARHSRITVSSPQFISGPWASSAPP